jgi:multidrug efflux system outer membrane protein
MREFLRMNKGRWMFRHAWMGLAAAALGAMASCRVVGPNYTRPAVDVPSTYKAATQPATTTAAAAIPTNWWLLFQDPDLTRIEDDAVRANPDLRAAMERVAQARDAVRVVASQFYPQITLDPSMTWGLAPGGGRNGNSVVGNTGLRIPFDLGYEIDLWGRIARSVESAKATVRVNAAQFAVIMQTLEADVAQDYFALRSLGHQDEILKRNVALFQQQLDLTKQKQVAGLAGGIDVAQVQAQLDQIITQELDIGRQRADTEHALAILTGRPPEEFSVGARSVETTEPDIPVGLPADLLRNRPDLVEAEQNLVAANANVGVAIANFYPTVRLTGSAGFENASIQKVVDWQSVLLSFGPSISVPIFEGGQLEASLAEAKSRYRELAATYESTLLGALRDVDVSLTDVRQYSDSLKAQEASVAASREYLRLAQLEYQQGIISLLQLIDADKTVLAADQTEEQLRNNRLTATVLLIKAIGGGWYPDAPMSRPAATEPAASGPASAPAP